MDDCDHGIFSKRAKSRYRFSVIFSVLFALCGSVLSEAQAEADLEPIQGFSSYLGNVVRIENIAISPDGKKTIVEVTKLNESKATRERDVVLLDIEKKVFSRLSATPGIDSSAAWSPDGKYIALLRVQEGLSRLQVLSISDGNRCTIESNGLGVSDFHWSPDSRKISFSSNQRNTQVPLPPVGVKIFTRADYRSMNAYVDDMNVSQIWLADIGAKCSDSKVRQLTKMQSPASFSFWSRDSERIFFTTNEVVETYYGQSKSSLRSVGISGTSERLERSLEPLNDDAGLTLSKATPSPDGTRIAFTMSDPRAPPGFAQNDIFIMELASGRVTNVTARYDREVGLSRIVWKDAWHVLSISTSEGNASVVEVDVRNGQVKTLWGGNREIRDFGFSSSSNRLIAVASDFVTPSEIYEVRHAMGIRLSHFNLSSQNRLALSVPESISYRGPGGDMIHGYLQKPPDFNPSRKYPLIVWVHGGPYTCWTSRYNEEVQAMAAAGYLVMYVNPRGSSSYGQEFASSASDDWVNVAYVDILAGVAALLFRPYVDEHAVGIAGISAGGIITDWAITHTEKFAAAASISDIADNSVYWFLGDQFDMADQNRQPWLDDSKKELSPITYGLNIKTPTLFMSGSKDFRTPPAAGGEMMFRLLKYLRVPTALIQFEGAGHGIYGGDARHQGLSIHYLLRWMDKYLKGESTPEFDIRPANRSSG
ncbi:S9 family peptidase [Xanthomonas euvesicatoria]|uniref:S9 family peptidase n=1 Tax=Xanthomonas euvesicatoria TaxID=456327 RepID=UPI001C444A8F|nr:S9 family peptidase [Xanthomonas euvesicatoria]MBV6885460.1 S9 family peptidase [Xanthomonas campestris pv. euphorbiae]